MPLHGMTWTDFSINLFLILPTLCWLWIYQVQFLFLSFHSLTLYKIHLFYLCDKLPSSWFFYLWAEDFYLSQSLQFFQEIHSIDVRYLSRGFPYMSDWAPTEPDLAIGDLLVFDFADNSCLESRIGWNTSRTEPFTKATCVSLTSHALPVPYCIMWETHLILFLWPASLRGIPCAQDCLVGNQQGPLVKGCHEQTWIPQSEKGKKGKLIKSFYLLY